MYARVLERPHGSYGHATARTLGGISWNELKTWMNIETIVTISSCRRIRRTAKYTPVWPLRAHKRTGSWVSPRKGQTHNGPW